MLYYQEWDWTCAIACLRSICSSIKALRTEDEIIEKYKLMPKPRYSQDIKTWDIKEYHARYGWDEYENINNVGFLYRLMKEEWYVSIEGLIMTTGWFCADIFRIILYDPYYNESKQLRAEKSYSKRFYCCSVTLISKLLI